MLCIFIMRYELVATHATSHRSLRATIYLVWWQNPSISAALQRSISSDWGFLIKKLLSFVLLHHFKSHWTAGWQHGLQKWFGARIGHESLSSSKWNTAIITNDNDDKDGLQLKVLSRLCCTKQLGVFFEKGCLEPFSKIFEMLGNWEFESCLECSLITSYHRNAFFEAFCFSFVECLL